MSNADAYLDAGDSRSESDRGYDSEAAELSKGRASLNKNGERPSKRRMIAADFYESEGSETDDVEEVEISSQRQAVRLPDARSQPLQEQDEKNEERLSTTKPPKTRKRSSTGDTPLTAAKVSKQKKPKKSSRPGVIYLSSLPPYLKPSALRNLLTQRGFEPINRLFLAPSSKAKLTSKKNSRQLYSEGWIEFASHKTARRCAEGLNASPIGGKKGGFYHDDLWNIKYLRDMGWDELMAGVQNERREEEIRQDQERRVIAEESKSFIEGVAEAKRKEGMERKRKGKKGGLDDDTDMAAAEPRRTWRQYDVKEARDAGRLSKKAGKAEKPRISDDVSRVLGLI